MLKALKEEIKLGIKHYPIWAAIRSFLLLFGGILIGVHLEGNHRVLGILGTVLFLLSFLILRKDYQTTTVSKEWPPKSITHENTPEN